MRRHSNGARASFLRDALPVLVALDGRGVREVSRCGLWGGRCELTCHGVPCRRRRGAREGTVWRRLSYRDAVRILGGDDSTLIDAAEAVLSVGVLGLATAEPAALGLVDACTKLSGLAKKLVAGLGRRLRGVPGHTRTELLVAAHTVIVVTAFFEALGEQEPKAGGARRKYNARRTKHELLGAVDGKLKLGHLVDALLSAPVPMPAPHRPYERTLADLSSLYTDQARRLTGEHGSRRADDLVASGYPPEARIASRAVERYEELFLQLAVDCPEFFVWANLQDHAATRRAVGEPLERLHDTLYEMRTGLAGLGAVLEEFASSVSPADWPDRLAATYRGYLDRPIAEASPDEGPVHIPTLAEAYVHPSFRATAMSHDAKPAVDAWWEELPLRGDIQAFLAGHLISPVATAAPLVVLGHPGGGKSVLTKVLAARLPAAAYLPVRVELRSVPADAGPQDQIEHALREATGERMEWPALVRAAGGALPVVLLDGFDELLQSTGVSRSDYLDQLAEFQRREVEQGRPVVVCVTSRTVVADQARIPAGSVVLRLEPFDDDQVRRWVTVWNAANRGGFARAGLRPLGTEAVLRYPHLACQPLLLLMLALYDAAGNPLQDAGGAMSHAELYERLLDRFIRRQITKHGSGLLPNQLDAAVHVELSRLSVVALAMLNRGRQSVTDEEVDADLRALLGETPAPDSAGFRAALSPARLLVGRFFFVHEAQATRDDAPVRAYEFLHATFGEYLIARMVLAALRDLADRTSSAARATALPSVAPRPDDDLLHALLSFAPLTDRESITDFLQESAEKIGPDLRASLHDLLTRLLRGCLRQRSPGTYDDYRPAGHNLPHRYAAYSANLLVLIVVLSGEVRVSDLFPDEPIPSWRRHAMLWKSQLSPSSWEGLVGALGLARTRSTASDRRPRDADLRVSFDSSIFPPKQDLADLGWSLAAWPGANFAPDLVAARTAFLGDPDVEAVLHAALPAVTRLSRRSEYARLQPTNKVVTVTHALLQLRLGSADVEDYDTCLDSSVVGSQSYREDDHQLRLHALVRQLHEDARTLPAHFVCEAIMRLARAPLSMKHRALLLESSIEQLGRDGADNATLGHILDRLLNDFAGEAHSIKDRLRMWLRITETGATALLGDPPSFTELEHMLDPPLAREPADRVGMLRLARELGRHDWVAEHAPELVAELPDSALFLLRPSEIEYLRATAAFHEELAERLDSIRRRHLL